MATALLMLNALNAWDVHSTIGAVLRGIREANPLMETVAHDPLVLAATKGALVAGGSLLIWRCRRGWWARAGAILVLVPYVAVGVLHWFGRP